MGGGGRRAAALNASVVVVVVLSALGPGSPPPHAAHSPGVPLRWPVPPLGLLLLLVLVSLAARSAWLGVVLVSLSGESGAAGFTPHSLSAGGRAFIKHKTALVGRGEWRKRQQATPPPRRRRHRSSSPRLFGQSQRPRPLLRCAAWPRRRPRRRTAPATTWSWQGKGWPGADVAVAPSCSSCSRPGRRRGGAAGCPWTFSSRSRWSPSCCCRWAWGRGSPSPWPPPRRLLLSCLRRRPRSGWRETEDGGREGEAAAVAAAAVAGSRLPDG